MPREDTQFKPGQKKPTRGKSFKSKLLDTIREEALLDCSTSSSEKAIEKSFLKHLATRAFDIDDPASPTLLKELLSKSYSSLKATMPTVEFEFDAKANPADQVSQLMDAASDGIIPPDVALTFTQAVKALVDIEVSTELKSRIEKLEELLGAKPS